MNQFSSKFYVNNRKRLCDSIPDTLVILPAHKMLQYSFDTPYTFRQESNFLYLTGINEPDLTMLLDTSSGECTLLYKDRNYYQKEWDGEVDIDKIKKISGINKIEVDINLDSVVVKAIKKGLKIGLLSPSKDRIEPFGFYANPAKKLLFNKLDRHKESFVDIRSNLALLRQFKNKIEIEEIIKAIDVTGKSLASIRNKINTYRLESEVEKDLTINFLKNGGDKHGFDPIVASEKNAATIHYKENAGKIIKNSLLLLDVGAQVGNYSADVSRTYEVGNATQKQKDVLNALLDVQQKIVSLVRPGVTVKELQEITENELKKKYDLLKIRHRKLPHGVSHHLGLDVHDLADYQNVLDENMIITIEPGIYLHDEKIGVRVEDDVLITKKGHKNLSGHIGYYT